MNTKSILTELRAERQRIDKAISALEALDGSGARVQPVGKASVVWDRKVATQKGRGRRTISAAGRKRISEMMKARWAARRKAAKKA
jgi:hypothetical protein